ncbi:hypothetical protein C9439_02815 [archaeon SCG-AAA382B04]|nr:hypothetical protein C9439_02815 [archaeon SCG-AAA382B04]
MRRTQLFFPLALPLLLIFFLIPFFLAYLVFSVGEILGFSPLTTLMIYLLILIGSVINIPLFKMKNKRPLVEEKRTNFFGFSPTIGHSKYVEVNLNLGGAVIPTLMSFYLIKDFGKNALLATFLATLIVVFVSKSSARLIKGRGIKMPTIVPPMTSVLASLAVSSILNVGYINLAKMAFFAGVIGVLIGADLLNLRKVKKLGVRMVSIGGAGTFDGIFLTGIFAAIFSSLFVI